MQPHPAGLLPAESGFRSFLAIRSCVSLYLSSHTLADSLHENTSGENKNQPQRPFTTASHSDFSSLCVGFSRVFLVTRSVSEGQRESPR